MARRLGKNAFAWSVTRGMVPAGASLLNRKRWDDRLDPNNAGLSWPGNSPHSSGVACDLVLVDAKGQDCHDCRAGVKGAPTCSIDQREASRILDLELDKTGAVRLSYEAWHYEWDAHPPNNRCKAGDCAAKFWPLTCTPR